MDVRRLPESAAVLSAELMREIAPGHLLHGRVWSVIARALTNDDVVAMCDDDVAIVSLTWTPWKPEQPPWPLTTFVVSAEDFALYIETELGDWEP